VRAVLASLVSLVVACGSSSSAPNPPPPPPVAVQDAGAAAVADPRIARGGAAFVKYCALCHGEAAQGYVADHAPSLRSPTFLESADDTFLARSIALGRPVDADGGLRQGAGRAAVRRRHRRHDRVDPPRRPHPSSAAAGHRQG
jgi:hypothetical protein